MSLKTQFISSTIYIAITKYSNILIGLIITATLSRLLTPDDFGLIAIVSVLVVFFNLFGELGIGAAIIQKKELSQQDIGSIFSFTIFIGLVLATIFFSMSSLVGSFYNQLVLINICQLFSISIFVSCTNIVPNALLLKEKKFKFLMFRQLSIQLVCGTFGIFSALAGWGVYALLLHSISSALFTFLVNYIHNPIKTVKISISSLRIENEWLNKPMTETSFFVTHIVSFFQMRDVIKSSNRFVKQKYFDNILFKVIHSMFNIELEQFYE
jgi:PST family polysaccharide transporter